MFRKTLLSLAAGSLLAAAAGAQTVDEIIAKNLQARGGLEKLKNVQSIRFTGKMTVGPGIEAPVTLELKRPKNLRMEFTFQGMTAIQGYDGKDGWMITPFRGTKTPEPMAADDLKEADEQADIDGPLVDYKAKGHTVELVGKDKVEGAEAYKLKVTLKNGDVIHFFIDSDVFLDVKTEAKRTIRGSEVEAETIFGDYKEVGGLFFPHAIEAGPKGAQQKQKITIEKVEINPPLDEAHFKMPKVEDAKPDAAKPGATKKEEPKKAEPTPTPKPRG
jgi:outer membrane lipoprotein-sorting protein